MIKNSDEFFSTEKIKRAIRGKLDTPRIGVKDKKEKRIYREYWINIEYSDPHKKRKTPGHPFTFFFTENAVSPPGGSAFTLKFDGGDPVCPYLAVVA